MRTSKKLLIGLAVLAVSVVGEEQCDVCKKDPYGLSDECWDVRLDDELELKVSIDEHNWTGKVVKHISVTHGGARLQWSTDSVDWGFFNHCRGVGIQPNLSMFTFRHIVGFDVGHPIDLHLIGNINWKAGVYEGPEVRKFFVRLLPCDVNAHKEAYKNRKISICPIIWFEGNDKCGLPYVPGMLLKLEWNYGQLQFTKTLDPKNIKWKNSGGGGVNEFNPIRDGEMMFFRIKPINKDALKTFYIDLDEGTVREELPSIDIPTVTIENNRKA